MLKYIVLFFFSFIAGTFFTRRIMKFAVRHDAVDKPTHRKVHRSIIPLWGGIAIYVGFFLTIAVFFLFSAIFRNTISMNNYILGRKLFGLFAGSTILVALGAVDDKWGLPPKVKLLGQIIAVIVVILFDVRIIGFTIPIYGKYVNFPFIASVAITLIWIVAIINSMNFIDGLDGLAGGIAFIACFSFFLLSVLKPSLSVNFMAGKVSYFLGIISIVLAGSILGFLRFNFNPARIFMGDCGSQFLGLMMASLSIIGSYKGITAFTLFTPALVLTIPIFDIIFAVVRRWRKHVPISRADKSHVHHRLLALGLTQKQVVVFLYTVSIIFSGLAIILA